jgi:hypothetical protein
MYPAMQNMRHGDSLETLWREGTGLAAFRKGDVFVEPNREYWAAIMVSGTVMGEE